MTWRPLAARARWIASIVASVPEFVKRQCGRPQRRRSSSATVIEPSVGAAKCVPSSIWARTAAAITGLAWPTHMTPNPLWKSMYSLPSTSHTREPWPRSRYTGHGSLRWKEEGTPPGMTDAARSYVRPEPAVRSRWIARSRSANSATRAGSIRVAAGSIVVMRTSVSAAPARACGVNPPSVQAASRAPNCALTE